MQERNMAAPATAGLTLTIVTPRGVACSVFCDAVTLPLADGGGIGIHKGHIAAEMALMQGVVRATKDGAPKCKVSIAAGFASIENDVVTVITDSAETVQDA